MGFLFGSLCVRCWKEEEAEEEEAPDFIFFEQKQEPLSLRCLYYKMLQDLDSSHNMFN